MAMSKKAKWAVYGAIIVIAVLGVSLYAGLLAIQQGQKQAPPPVTAAGLFKVTMDAGTCGIAVDAVDVATFPADHLSCNIYDTVAGFTVGTTLTVATHVQDINTGLNTQVWGFTAGITSVPQSRVSGVMVPIFSYASDGVHWSVASYTAGAGLSGVTYNFDSFQGSEVTANTGTFIGVFNLDAGARAAVVAGQNYPFVFNFGGVSLTATLYIMS